MIATTVPLNHILIALSYLSKQPSIFNSHIDKGGDSISQIWWNWWGIRNTILIL